MQVKVSDGSVDAQIYMSLGVDWGQVAEFLSRLAGLDKPTDIAAVKSIELDDVIKGAFSNTKSGMTFARGQGQLDSISLRVDVAALENVRRLLPEVLSLSQASDLTKEQQDEIKSVADALADQNTKPQDAPLLVLRLLARLGDTTKFETLSDCLKLAIVDFDSCRVALRPWEGRFGGFAFRKRKAQQGLQPTPRTARLKIDVKLARAAQLRH